MRRFEVYGAKPKHVWEVAVDDTKLVERETIGSESTDQAHAFATAAKAEQALAAAIAERRTRGFVEIKKLAAYDGENAVKRSERFEWQAGYVKHYVELSQDDREAKRKHGQRDANGHELGHPQIDYQRPHYIAEASKLYDAWRAEAVEARRAAKETGAPARSGTHETVRDPALEAQCRAAAPDDATPWAVYADWLSSHGDRLGEVAGLALGGKAIDARAALRAWFPELGKVPIELVQGFPRAITLRDVGECDALATEARTVLACAALRFVDTITLQASKFEPDCHDWSVVFEALDAMAFAARLRHLVLEADTREERDVSLDGIPAVDWRRFPQLESLVIGRHAGGNFDRFELPRLRRLARISGALPSYELAAILDSEWPALESLELWLGAGTGIRTVDLAALLDGTRFPRLGDLALANSELAGELIPALADSALLPRLYALDLSKGTLGDDELDALIDNAPRFRHLASLDLSESFLSERAIARIRKVLDNVIVDGQHDPLDADERFVSTGE